MFNLQTLIDHIIAETGYTDVALASDIKMDLTHGIFNEPEIRVQFAGVKTGAITPDVFMGDGYSEQTEPLILTINCHFACIGSDLPTVWNTLKLANEKFALYPENKEYSRLTYMNGSIMGLQNGRIWWSDNWKIIGSRIG